MLSSTSASISAWRRRKSAQLNNERKGKFMKTVVFRTSSPQEEVETALSLIGATGTIIKDDAPARRPSPRIGHPPVAMGAAGLPKQRRLFLGRIGTDNVAAPYCRGDIPLHMTETDRGYWRINVEKTCLELGITSAKQLRDKYSSLHLGVHSNYMRLVRVLSVVDRGGLAASRRE